MMTIIEKYSRNIHGRDFVVGDIHGAFDLVREGLQDIGFKPNCDRLFCVGDLIDRGPYSAQCIEFLARPFVHAVRGNHEDMLLNLYADGEPDAKDVDFMVENNGFAWWLKTPEHERQKIIEALSALPLVMEVETARGTVGILHADIPAHMSWPVFINQLEAGDEHTIQTCLWGRTRIDKGNDRGVAGIGRVFVGHTPQWGGAARYGNVYAVDTGAVYGQSGEFDEGRLTIASLHCTTNILTAPQPTLSLIDLRVSEADSRRFGRYAV